MGVVIPIGFARVWGRIGRWLLNCPGGGAPPRGSQSVKGESNMKDSLLKVYVWAKIWKDDNGQDLIEYALVAALIAFAAVATMNTLAESINSAFSKIGSKLDSSMAG